MNRRAYPGSFVSNASVDYALAHGVNYFDTSPRYCKGKSERAMGIALSRHPRDRYLIATKMSNQTARGRDDSIAMYHRSLELLKVQYFDYYLVHSVGTFPVYKERYLDNGILDFMLKEREAGRIRHLGWSFHGEREFFDTMMSSGVPWDFVQIQASYFDWKNAIGRSNVEARYLYDVQAKKNIPAIIMEPLLGGRLARPHFKAQEMLKQAAPEASIASWAFRFAGSLPNVLTVLSGMTFAEIWGPSSRATNSCARLRSPWVSAVSALNSPPRRGPSNSEMLARSTVRRSRSMSPVFGRAIRDSTTRASGLWRQSASHSPERWSLLGSALPSRCLAASRPIGRGRA